VARDGDGWTRCARGHDHWGLFGAAGLLLAAPDDEGRERVLLQHRAAYSHHGDTWGVPGGARGSGETAVQAAVREAAEETGLDPGAVSLTASYVDDHGGWAYTTVLARAGSALPVRPQDTESIALEWVPLTEVADRVLHPGFAVGWPGHLADLLRTA
jgi:8-oxo-dGTP diphosphatase